MHTSARGQGREGQGQTALVMSGLWLSVYVHHAAWETTVAKVAHGVSMNALGKMFGVWASTILTWIRRYAADHSETPDPSGKAIVLEIDEMWHFLKKNGANSGSGRLVIVIQAASWTGSAGVVMRQP
jgi:transposase